MINLSNGHNQNNDNQEENKNNQNLELLPYEKTVSFKWEKLKFGNEFELLTDSLIFNLWDNNFELQKNLHINDNLEIHYKHDGDCVYFKLKIENINGTIERGKLGRMRYFIPTSLIQTGFIYNIFSAIEDKISEKLRTSEAMTRTIPKKSRFRGYVEKQHGKWAKILFKFEAHLLYHIY